jgi:hypothetical protein
MRYFFTPFLSFCFLIVSVQTYSQGCSDAGVCSVGSLSLVQFKYELLPLSENKLAQLPNKDPGIDLKHSGEDNMEKDTASQIVKSDSTSNRKLKNVQTIKYDYQLPKYSFQYSTYYGLGQQKTSIITEQIDANIRLINKKLFAQVKVPYTFINGKLGSVSGLSDITLGLTYIAFVKSNSSLSLACGAKTPTNNSDLAKDTLPLPMVYQTSLGSTDILLGAKYTFKKWDLSLGYQHSFNANKNEYLHRSITNDSTIYNDYFESNFLRRSDDGVFRISRNFLSKKINASIGALFIYHMANDSYTDANGVRGTLAGSQGLTLNLNFAGTIPISKKLDFVFILGTPIVTRKAAPDGLLRKFVGIVGFKYNVL